MKTATIATTSFLPAASLFASLGSSAKNVRVVVWDERQPEQKEAYSNFLGNEIAEHLRRQPGLTVRSVALDDEGQGLQDDVLDNCDVLVWWGHQRQAEITKETGKKLVDRISSGKLSLIALHSAHWATPFVEAMNEITRRNEEQKIKDRKIEVSYIEPAKKYTVPAYDARPTPYTDVNKFPDGTEKHTVHLPVCCFPGYRNDGKPSTIEILKQNHPIVKGVPRTFTISQTEMYNEIFHVPEPDEVILEEKWETGEWFRSGMLWKLGKGKVFYFRPGHEIYPVYKQEMPLRIITNAVKWLGSK
jgi:trehalose utilization protein